MLADSCGKDNEKRKASFRILLGMLYSHAHQVASLCVTLQESILRRVVASLIGKPDLPLPVLLMLYTIWGEWKMVARAHRREKKLFTAFDTRLAKESMQEILWNVWEAWTSTMEKKHKEKAAAKKIALVLTNQTDKSLMIASFDAWTGGIAKDKHKFLEQRKLMSIMSSSSSEVLYRNAWLAWVMDLQEAKHHASRRREKEIRIGKVLGAIDGGNNVVLMMNVFHLWTKEVKSDRARREQRELEEQMRAFKESSALETVSKMLNASNGFLKYDVWVNWKAFVTKVKEQTQAAKKMMTVMNMGEESMVGRTAFGAWVDAMHVAKQTRQKLRKFQLMAFNEDARILEDVFKEWHWAAGEAKQAMENSKKTLFMLTANSDSAVSQMAFGAWHKIASAERQAREMAATRESQQEAVMKSMMLMAGEQDSVLIATVYSGWAKELQKSKVAKALAEKQAKHLKTLQAVMQGDMQLLLLNVYRAWQMEVIHQNHAFRQEVHKAQEEAARLAKGKSMQMMFNNNAQMVLINVISGWQAQANSARNDHQHKDKLMNMLAGGVTSALLTTCVQGWSKQAKRVKEKAAKVKMASMMTAGNDEMELNKYFGAWVKMREMIREKLEHGKKMVSLLAQNDSTTTLRMVIGGWIKYCEGERADRRAGVQKQEAAARLINNWTGASVAGGFRNWVQYVRINKIERENQKKQDTMEKLLGDSAGPLLLSKWFYEWVKIWRADQTDAEMSKIMKGVEAAHDQKSWVSGKIMIEASMTLLLGMYLHWAHFAVGNKFERIRERQAYRTQHVPLMIQHLLDRLSDVYRETYLLWALGAWKQSVGPKLAAKARVNHARSAALKSFGETSKKMVFVVWRDFVRTLYKESEAAARFDSVSRAGLTRWLAADAVLLMTAAMSEWRQAMRVRAPSALAVQHQASESRRWQDEAARHLHASNRAMRAAETAVTALLSRVQSRRIVHDTFLAWRRTYATERSPRSPGLLPSPNDWDWRAGAGGEVGAAGLGSEASRAKREAGRAQVFAFVKDMSDTRSLRRALMSWRRAIRESTFRNAPSVYVFGGFGCHSPAEAERLDVQAGTWQPLPRMPQPRCAAAAVCLGNTLCVVGGFHGRDFLSSASAYDPHEGRWEMLPDMNERRGYVAAAAQDGFIYAVCGFDGETRLSSVERYNLDASMWTACPSVARRRQCVAVASLDGCLYVVGGDDGTGSCNSFERFDPLEGQWEMMPSMSSRRSGAVAVAVRSRLLVIGGSDGQPLSGVEEFDPGSGSWSQIPPMRVRRDALGAALIGDSVYVFGGHDGALRQRSMERLNPLTLQWEDVEPAPLQARNFAAVAAGPS